MKYNNNGTYEDIVVKAVAPGRNTYSSSTSEVYSCDYTNKIIKTTKTTSDINNYSCNYINNAVTGTLLWTNSSPGNDFAEQTVQLDLTNYDTFDVYFRVVRNSGSVAYAKVLKNISTLLTGTQMYSASVVRAGNRAISISDTGISFGNGRRLTSFSAGEDNAATCIPVYVIGYKTGTTIS